MAEKWIVWRRDDNGNQYEVARYDSKEEAEATAEEFESRRHRQVYWVEPVR
jgi:ribose 5-phosphate isomerase B